MKEKNAERILISGRSGSGKSCFTKERIKELDRFIIFDVLDEYGSITNITRIVSLSALKMAIRKRWIKGFKLAYVPKSGSEKKELHNLSKFLLQLQRLYKEGRDSRGLTLVVEEMNTCFPITSLSADQWGFGEICSRGRHYGISVLGIAQRSAEVNTRFRGNCSYQIYFPPQDHRDLQTISQVIGPKYKTKLQNLQTHHYLKFQDGVVTEGKNKL